MDQLPAQAFGISKWICLLLFVATFTGIVIAVDLEEFFDAQIFKFRGGHVVGFEARAQYAMAAAVSLLITYAAKNIDGGIRGLAEWVISAKSFIAETMSKKKQA